MFGYNSSAPPAQCNNAACAAPDGAPSVVGGERIRHRDTRIYGVDALVELSPGLHTWIPATRWSIPNWSAWEKDPRRVRSEMGFSYEDTLMVGTARDAQDLWKSLVDHRSAWDEELRVSQILHTVTEVTLFEGGE